jgi:hypothetical protein
MNTREKCLLFQPVYGSIERGLHTLHENPSCTVNLQALAACYFVFNAAFYQNRHWVRTDTLSE